MELRRECAQGMAEARYQAGRYALRDGNRELAFTYAKDAKELRHPRAQTLIEAIEGDPTSSVEKDVSAIAHRRNDKDYKADRDSIRRRLRRSAQYLAVADLDKALEECVTLGSYKRYVRLACHSLCKHRFTRTGRADKQNVVTATDGNF